MSDGCCGMCKWHQYDEYGKDWVFSDYAPAEDYLKCGGIHYEC